MLVCWQRSTLQEKEEGKSVKKIFFIDINLPMLPRLAGSALFSQKSCTICKCSRTIKAKFSRIIRKINIETDESKNFTLLALTVTLSWLSALQRLPKVSKLRGQTWWMHASYLLESGIGNCLKKILQSYEQYEFRVVHPKKIHLISFAALKPAKQLYGHTSSWYIKQCSKTRCLLWLQSEAAATNMESHSRDNDDCDLWKIIYIHSHIYVADDLHLLEVCAWWPWKNVHDIVGRVCCFWKREKN